MTKADQIAAEIVSGGSALAEQVHTALFIALGWQALDEPPKDGSEVLIQRNYRMRWENYANERVKKAQGSEGRWLIQDEDGAWKAAKMPKLKLWRTT